MESSIAEFLWRQSACEPLPTTSAHFKRRAASIASRFRNPCTRERVQSPGARAKLGLRVFRRPYNTSIAVEQYKLRGLDIGADIKLDTILSRGPQARVFFRTDITLTG